MKHIIVFLSGLIIISCLQQSEKNPGIQNQFVRVDSLNAAFLAGWNNKDSVSIVNTIADDAIVMNDSLIHVGIQNISKHWISGGLKVLSNIKTISSSSKSNESMAYDGGTYSLDLTIPGGPVLKEKGNYSLVWTKKNVNDWRLMLIHIEDITRMPDIK